MSYSHQHIPDRASLTYMSMLDSYSLISCDRFAPSAPYERSLDWCHVAAAVWPDNYPLSLQLDQELVDNYLSGTGELNSVPEQSPGLPELSFASVDDSTMLSLAASLLRAQHPTKQCSSDVTATARNPEGHIKHSPINEPSSALPPPVACIDPALIYPIPPPLQEATSSSQTSEDTCRRGASISLSPSSSTSTSPSPSFPRELITCKRRNRQVSRSARASANMTPRNRWNCPYCEFVQRNRRSPDLKRHIQTHSDKGFWKCCGVPLVDAAVHGVPEEAMRDVSEFEGIFMVGGCGETFGRKDAYVRHLKERRGRCFGDKHALYQPGNRTDVGKQ